MEINLTFCTYFKSIKRFVYKQERYEEYVAFCVKRGKFRYSIGEGEVQIISAGEVVICPPNNSFHREIIEETELCMIKFNGVDASHFCGKTIKVSNLFRFNDDLAMLEPCMFCDTLSCNPTFAHYCMDILYLVLLGMEDNRQCAQVKRYIEQNYDKELFIFDLAKQMGYSVPHLINKFKGSYGVTPKAYLSQVRVNKAKELLTTTELLSREIAYAIGFSDELYFIRFFKKQTGVTPLQFRKCSL